MLRSAVVDILSQGTWEAIRADHGRVQLGWREDLGPGWGKGKYVKAVVETLGEDELVALGERCRDAFPERALALQNALWWLDAKGVATVTEVTRLALADAFDGRVLHPREALGEWLQQFGGGLNVPSVGYTAEGQLWAEPFDITGLSALFGGSSGPPPKKYAYSHRALLDCFSFRQWPDKRLFLFLEALVHPSVRQGADQADWVALINRVLDADGWSLVETGRMSNHPLFLVRRHRAGVPGRPKNLIFAAAGPKPELGFADAINNDVVILRNAEHCLVYDEALTDDGLLWEQLMSWWASTQGLDARDVAVRKQFGERLRSSLGSEPERQLFATYFRHYLPILGVRLPALIPQVYLHYDPVHLGQLRARGEDRRFLVQRMDFLLLLRHRARVVVEIDGQQHYADVERQPTRPSPERHAETMRGDRELRLAGYEVYRFGAHELSTTDRCSVATVEFFDELFRRHEVQ